MNAKKIIARTGGQFFTVTFEKKDGSTRVLNGRIAVKSHLHGGKRTTDPSKYAIVYDVHKKGYRSVAYDKIKQIKAGGKLYKK